MKPRITLSELIEQYLNKEMQEADRKAFEERLEKEPELKAEIENYQILMKGIERSALKAQIQKRFKSYKTTQLILKTALVVVTAATLGTAIYFGAKALQHRNNPKDSKELPALNETGTSTWSEADRNLPANTYHINSGKDTVLETPGGILLAIPAGTFADDQNQPFQGEVNLSVKEALDAASIIKAGLSTKSGDKQLETGGMFYINALDGDRQLKIASGKSITAQVPTDEIKPDMQLFDGVRKVDGSIDWVNPKPLEHFLVPVNILNLDFYPPNYLDTLAGMHYNISDKKFTDSLYYSYAWTHQSDKINHQKDTIIETIDFDRTDTTPISSLSGRNLFLANCASCHYSNDQKLTGPGLAFAKQRIPTGDWIYRFIHNSSAVIKSGDKYANKIFRDYSQSLMTPFPALTNQEIDKIMAFIDHENMDQSSNIGINPAKVKAIWNNQFQNSLLATKEFEERMPWIHRSCNEKILDLYVNNLDKNMWEIDSMAMKIYSSPGDIQNKFHEFYLKKDGKVKNGDKNASMLRNYYEKKSKLFSEAIAKTRREYWQKEKQADDDYYRKSSDHTLKEAKLNNANFEKEFKINLKEAYNQLGINYDTTDHPYKYTGWNGNVNPYTAQVSNLGWHNVDRYVLDATMNRTTLDYTDPQTGKKAIIRYDELKVNVADFKNYDRVYAYLIPDKLNNYMRLNGSNGQFVEKLNELISNKLVCAGYKGDKLYYAVIDAVKPGTQIVSLKPGTDKELNSILAKNGDYASKAKEINEELAFQKYAMKEDKRIAEREKKEAFIERIRMVVLPCRIGVSAPVITLIKEPKKK